MQFEIRTLLSTPLATNNYLLVGNDFAVLVEATASVEQIERALGGRKLDAVFLTHSHFDHASNLENILKAFDTKCYMNEKCHEKIVHHEKQFYGDRAFSVEGCDDKIIFVCDGDEIEVGGKKFLCLQTPGHTDDSMSFVFQDKIFVGDLIFRGGFGRVDLPSGNDAQEEESIEKVLSFPTNYEIYPGHGETTSIEEVLRMWSVE